MGRGGPGGGCAAGSAATGRPGVDVRDDSEPVARTAGRVALVVGPWAAADGAEAGGDPVRLSAQLGDAGVVVDGSEPSEATAFRAGLHDLVRADESGDVAVQLVGGRDPAGGHVDHAETDVTGRCCDRGDRRVEESLARFGELVGPARAGAAEVADPCL